MGLTTNTSHREYIQPSRDQSNIMKPSINCTHIYNIFNRINMTYRKKRLEYLVAIIIVIILLSIIYSKMDNKCFYLNTTIHKKGLPVHTSKNIPIYIVMCKGTDKNRTSLQVRQTATLLKSAAALTKSFLKFKIFSDSESLYKEVMLSLKKWPEEYQNRLQVNLGEIIYPNDVQESDIKYTLRKHPCGSYRLWFPEMFKDIDAALYIDTDVIFMQPPEILFEEFDKFNKEEVAAISKDTYENKKVSFPFPKPAGLNSGIMLMNFTRMRSAPGGGFTTEVTTNLLREYKDQLVYGDQDLINIYFGLNPNLLHNLGCDWNFLKSFCKYSDFTCPEAEKYGVSLLHGITESFYTDGIFKELFTVWEEYDLNTPIHLLFEKLKLTIEIYEEHVH